MLGLITPAVITRRTRTSQTASGASVLASAVVWSGKCSIKSASSGDARYQGGGVETVATHVIFLPPTAGPLVGDTITAGGRTYLVEFPALDSRGHHLEVKVRLVTH